MKNILFHKLHTTLLQLLSSIAKIIVIIIELDEGVHLLTLFRKASGAPFADAHKQEKRWRGSVFPRYYWGIYYSCRIQQRLLEK